MKGNKIVPLFFSMLLLFPAPFSAQAEAFRLEKAVAVALEHNLDVKLLESQLNESAAAVQIAIGATDFTLGSGLSQTRTLNPVDSNDTASYRSYLNGSGTDSTAFSVWLQKQFSFGLGIKTTVAYDRTKEMFWDANEKKWHYANEAYGTASYPKHYGSAQIELTLPLMKSFNNASAGNTIKIQKAQQLAAMQSLQNGISTIVLETADAYWSYWCACRKLAYYRQAEEHMKSLSDDVKKLVDSGERTSFEYTQILAELSAYTLNRIAGEQEVEQTQNTLATVMGIPVTEVAAYGEPADDIPDADSQTAIAIDTAQGIQEAEKQRADLLALQEKLNAADITAKQAKLNTMPDLNINFALGYKGLYYGDSFGKAITDAYTQNVIGPDFTGGLSFSVDFGSKNKGIVTSAEERRKQASLEVQKLKQQIEYDVVMQASTITKSLQILQQSNQTMQYYTTAAEGEAKKLSAGYATVDSLTSIQDKQISSSVRYLESVKQFITALLRYKYTTGKLTGTVGSSEEIYKMQ